MKLDFVLCILELPNCDFRIFSSQAAWVSLIMMLLSLIICIGRCVYKFFILLVVLLGINAASIFNYQHISYMKEKKMH